jgi:hypothetical protein
VKLANNLVECLKNSLYPIFGDRFDRKFSTVWSTLGYFDHRDFNITKEFADTFQLFKKLNYKQLLEIEIDKLSLLNILTKT